MPSPQGTTLTQDTSHTIRRVVDEAPSRSVQELRDQFGARSQRPGTNQGAVAEENAPMSSGNSSGATSYSSDQSESSSSAAIDPDEFTRLLRENFDLIVELLEARLASDIERRGGRYGGDF